MDKIRSDPLSGGSPGPSFQLLSGCRDVFNTAIVETVDATNCVVETPVKTSQSAPKNLLLWSNDLTKYAIKSVYTGYGSAWLTQQLDAEWCWMPRMTSHLSSSLSVIPKPTGPLAEMPYWIQSVSKILPPPIDWPSTVTFKNMNVYNIYIRIIIYTCFSLPMLFG